MREYKTPTEAADNIRIVGALFAKAKSDRINLDNFRKSKRAMLFLEAPEKTDKAKEAWSMAHKDYLEVCKGLKEAVLKEESYRFEIKSAELKIEVWRSMQATKRQEMVSLNMTT